MALVTMVLLLIAREALTLVAPHDAAACTSDGSAAPQEKMPLPQRLTRQAIFRQHVSRDHPTLKELLAADSTHQPTADGTVPVTAILNHWQRRTLCKQLDSLRTQSVAVAHIWVCLFASPLAASARGAALAYNDSRIAIFETQTNLKYYGRFQLALSAQTRYVWLLDDDMIPGRRYLAQMLHVSGTHFGEGALLGSIGWLLPKPRPQDLRLGSYRSLENGTGGLYVPDLAYDIMVERMVQVDYLCSMWFGESSLVRLLFAEAPITFATGEDFHLSHMLRKRAGVRSLVMPVQFDDRATWGDTDHALAYGRYTTGGRAKIELRDRIWWSGVQGGGTLHWALPSPVAARAADESVVVMVDGSVHSKVFRPLLSRYQRFSIVRKGVHGGGVSAHVNTLLAILN